MVDAYYNSGSLPGASPFLLDPPESGSPSSPDRCRYSPQQGARLHLFRPRDTTRDPNRGENLKSEKYQIGAGAPTGRLITRGKYQPTNAFPRPRYTPIPGFRRQDAFKDSQTELLHRLGILYDENDDDEDGASTRPTEITTDGSVSIAPYA
ncbi:unnamed protein product [Parascedosporium putredinis]|uniref:Uncharacterized protein n=1 Tax=Parascedosporium putredinis TaxID=1442378 RepID=A0A9P1H7N9_9PEZI|nr:unnamed protein product [Parascedosporium putredinis]CAI8001552.1 unnamed protein product [Parascedosporium putredinis]